MSNPVTESAGDKVVCGGGGSGGGAGGSVEMEETLANPSPLTIFNLGVCSYETYTPCVTTRKECLRKPCFENGR